MRKSDDEIAIPLAGLAALGVSGVLVGVRGEIRPEVIAVTLAAVVALGGRLGGRRAGVVGAIVAALSFDFMHTRPYLSLKIDDLSDALLTLVLLAVGLGVGGLAATSTRQQRRLAQQRPPDHERLRRVLDVSRTATGIDVELAVRAELMGLLHLEDCFFVDGEVSIPVLTSTGAIEGAPVIHYTEDGFELPRSGVAIRVAAYGTTFGFLVCIPTQGVAAPLSDRTIAAELADVLALAVRAAA
ncbi:MAG: hypothetical protein V7636_329 [Actinomycetota bacterium]